MILQCKIRFTEAKTIVVYQPSCFVSANYSVCFCQNERKCGQFYRFFAAFFRSVEQLFLRLKTCTTSGAMFEGMYNLRCDVWRHVQPQVRCLKTCTTSGAMFEGMYNLRCDADLCQEFDSLNFVFLDKLIFNFGWRPHRTWPGWCVEGTGSKILYFSKPKSFLSCVLDQQVSCRSPYPYVGGGDWGGDSSDEEPPM